MTDPGEPVRLLDAMQWRSIGPHRGGRVAAVAGHPSNLRVFYFGSSGGGVWKTWDAGHSWRNVSDGYFRRASMGALAVAPSDPNVVYAGTGEYTMRGNISVGDGVYRSRDGGTSWVHAGLEPTQCIARICVHPQNADRVYVAALGHPFGPNPERGVYRSVDGGGTWEHVLGHSADVGAADLALDPTNPRVVYASLWNVRRTPWSFSSGGSGSGLMKSTDGGTTWADLTTTEGFPRGVLGRIGIAVSPAREGRLWAIVEAREGGVFRSDDAGHRWRRVSTFSHLRARPWYFNRITADPLHPDRVYALNVYLWRSDDGGQTFVWLPSPHPDHHDLWIDPSSSDRLMLGHDGGASASLDGGRSWSSIDNQPTGEFYHLATDGQVPYRVFGTQQDNNTLSVPSASDNVGIAAREWFEFAGDESGHIAVSRKDPNLVFTTGVAGYMTRYHHLTRRRATISVWPRLTYGWPAKFHRYRFNWTFPVATSPFDPDVLYAAGNCLFRSRDDGDSWQVISPDLTRNDPSKLESSGGPITHDNVGTETYCTIFAFAESPAEEGTLWVGSDDGLVHLSRDNGASWENVTPPEMPEWALVTSIEPSRFSPGTAYVTATRYKLDDFRPFVYKTEDYGKHWHTITAGLPGDEFVRVVREDRETPGLLFLGTERGVWVSFDAGSAWQPLQQNMPVVPVHDIVVERNDLVIATHGRAFWILDNIAALRQITGLDHPTGTTLFRPGTTYRLRVHHRLLIPEEERVVDPAPVYATQSGMVLQVAAVGEGGHPPVFLDAGTNPPGGVVVDLYLDEIGDAGGTLTFVGPSGDVVRSFSLVKEGATASEGPAMVVRPGANRLVWDMRGPEPVKVPGAVYWRGELAGPLVPPGQYQVRLDINGTMQSQSFEIRSDPRADVSDAELEEQFSFLMQVGRKLSEVHTAVNAIRATRSQAQELTARLSRTDATGPIMDHAAALLDRLDAIERALIQVEAGAPQDLFNVPPMLNNQLAYLIGLVAADDGAPNRQSHDVFGELVNSIDQLLVELRGVIERDVPVINRLALSEAVPAIVVPTDVRVTPVTEASE